MAGLIIEVCGRGLSLYERVEHLPHRIGRAPDNDLILGDPTVSPHHAELIVSETGGVAIVDLDSENGTWTGNRRVALVSASVELPVDLRLGQTRLRLMDSSSAVEPTRVLGCQGWFSCLFESPWSAAVLVLLALAVAAGNVWLATSTPIELDGRIWLWLAPISGLVAYAAIIAGFQRLTTGRWGVASSLALTSVAIIAGGLLAWLGPAANYALTELWPKSVLNVIGLGLLLPTLGWVVLVRVRHAPRLATSFFMLALTSMLIMGPALEAYRLHARPDSARRGVAVYPRELFTFDIRLQPTLSIYAFIDEANALQAGKRVDGVDAKGVAELAASK